MVGVVSELRNQVRNQHEDIVLLQKRSAQHETEISRLSKEIVSVKRVNKRSITASSTPNGKFCTGNKLCTFYYPDHADSITKTNENILSIMTDVEGIYYNYLACIRHTILNLYFNSL